MRLIIFVLIMLAMTSVAKAGVEDCDKIRKDGLTCLACNIYHEARGQSEEDQLMVGHVTMQRVKSKHYPDNICAVVWQKNPHRKTKLDVAQFSWTLDGRSDKVHESDAWDIALAIAKMTITHYTTEFEMLPSKLDNVDGIMWYHSLTVDPYWADTLEKVFKTDGHIYYRNPALQVAQNDG